MATLSEDRVVINGRKADWISNGTIAEVCILYCAADTGLGPDPERGCVVIVPMDAPGVSRGAPLDKLGQRALNQGAVIFEDVVLPVSNVLAGPDDYQRAAYQVLVLGNACMGAIFAGTARAAYELALDYARERRQGGVPIAAHQSVAYRLFHMYRKVEAARALARRAMLYNFTQPVPRFRRPWRPRSPAPRRRSRSPATRCRYSAAQASAVTAPSRRSSGTPGCR